MTFILCSPIAALTWVLIATSHHVWVILLSRCFKYHILPYHQPNCLGSYLASSLDSFKQMGKCTTPKSPIQMLGWFRNFCHKKAKLLQGKHWHGDQQLVHAGLPLHLRLQLLHHQLAHSCLDPTCALRPPRHLLLLCSQFSLLAG